MRVLRRRIADNAGEPVCMDANGATRKLVELVERAQANGREQGPLVPVEALVTIEGDDLVNYIALRKKSGIDTLDASDEDRSSASQIDVSMYDAHRIRGFLRDGVSFGGATAFSASLESGDQTTECALLIPDLTRHTDVVEVIACAFLREKLSLADDDIVRIHVS